MVSCNDDKSFLAVLFVEIHGDANCVIKRQNFPKIGCGVVRVSAMVDFTAFNHEEEAFWIIKDFNALTSVIGKRRRIVLSVNCKRETAVVRDRQQFVHFWRKREEGRLIPADSVSCLCGEFENVSPVFGICSVVMLSSKATAAEILEIGINEIQSNAIKFGAAFAMGIESCGRGVIDGNGGDDSHLFAFAMSNFSHRLQAPFAISAHSNATIGSFFTAGDGCGRRCRIRHKRICGTCACRSRKEQSIHCQMPMSRLLGEFIRQHTLWS